jgi:hypothetical protein
MEMGISCLTPENLSAPWILYEAGALSKTINDRSRLCTLLIANLTPKDVPNPLGMFQHTMLDKFDMLRMLRTLNKAMGENAVPEDDLKDIFESMFWPRFEDKIRTLPATDGAEPPKRQTEDMLSELLDYARENANKRKETEWLDPWIPTFKQFFPLLAQAIAQMPQPPAPFTPKPLDPTPGEK